MKFDLQPPPGYYLETVRSSGSSPNPVRYAVYDIADIVSGRRVLNIDVKREFAPKYAHITPSTLTAHRFQTGLVCFLWFCHLLYYIICLSCTVGVHHGLALSQ